MTQKINFNSFSFDEKLTKFPTGVMEYLRFSKTLDTSRLTNLDMIPAGLKGVKVIQVKHEKENDFPRFISPDFMGKIGYVNVDGEWCPMPKDLILEAKKNYIKYRKLVESSRHPKNGLCPVCVLPTKMAFLEKGNQIYLDLRKTTITEPPFVLGAYNVIMPQKIAHHRTGRISCSKIKVYE